MTLEAAIKRGHGYKGLQSLWCCIFFKKNAQTFLIFLVLGLECVLRQDTKVSRPNSASCQNPCSWFSYSMTLPVSKILVGKRLSWVLKLWHLTEAQISPTISKNQKVWAFLEKMATQKASQTLISTPPLFQFRYGTSN